MKYSELTNKSIEELYEALYDMKKELLGLNIQKSLQQIQSTAAIRQKRRNSARIMTAIRAKNAK